MEIGVNLMSKGVMYTNFFSKGTVVEKEGVQKLKDFIKVHTTEKMRWLSEQNTCTSGA